MHFTGFSPNSFREFTEQVALEVTLWTRIRRGFHFESRILTELLLVLF
jgi:hypothetical protein